MSQEPSRSNLLAVSQLIDLTDKPIGLTRDEISWARVKSTASNCICCCCSNSVTLVTTNDSYILDHVPLDNIQCAQTNANLQHLALANHRRLVVIDLVDNGLAGAASSTANLSRRQSAASTLEQQTSPPSGSGKLKSETKVVHLASQGLTMDDIVYWRWIDDQTLAILSHETLYTCSIDQPQISHPALSALASRSRYLSMERVCDVHPNLISLCQVTDIQRDQTGNLFAISSLYSTSSLLDLQQQQQPTPPVPSSNASGPTQQMPPQPVGGGATQVSTASSTVANKLLRPSFGSMPSRLSQLVNGIDPLPHPDQSFDSATRRLHHQPTSATTSGNGEDEIYGLVQVHCKLRDRSQLIQAHAVTFTSAKCPMQCDCNNNNNNNQDDAHHDQPTILVSANKTSAQLLRFRFIEMVTSESQLNRNGSSGGLNASPSMRLAGADFREQDFPTSIVCTQLECRVAGGGGKSGDNSDTQMHVAMVTSKFGHLFVCNVTHGTILFHTSITNDVISSSILERNTNGLMLICRNGQVLLARLNSGKLMQLLDESKTLRHISSAHQLAYRAAKRSPIDSPISKDTTGDHEAASSQTSSDMTLTCDQKTTTTNDQTEISDVAPSSLSASLEAGLELIISTKL